MSEHEDKLTALLGRRHDWPLIARDIALMALPVDGATQFSLDDIAKAHHFTAEEFAALLDIPAFLTLVEQEVSHAHDLGPHAGVRLRAEAMAMALQEELFRRSQSGTMDDKACLQLLSILMRSAGIEQPLEQVQAQAQAQQNTVNIAFNLPRLPTNRKLAHLMNRPQVTVVEESA